MRRADDTDRMGLADTVIGDSSPGSQSTPPIELPSTRPPTIEDSRSALAPGSSDRPGAADDSTTALADTMISSSGKRPLELDLEDAEEALVGKRIDHFKIESVLGKGGMGAVYIAHDLSLDRRVALKMLRGALAKPDHEGRLMREARAQAKLTHSNVVGIYYIGRAPSVEPGTPGPLYLAMEYVEGEPLDAITERGDRMHSEEARIAMLQVARALRAAKRAGIIHRDIKPSNLLRGKDGVVKIADFGLAKPVEADVRITQEGAFVGSPLYMSPEQGSDEPLDHRSDMYSLGATFYHLLAGHPPFGGSSPLKVISAHLTKAPPPLAEAAPDVPPALRAVIMKLLSKDADDRYDDYDDLIDALVAAAPDATHYGGFWIRTAAVVVDVLGVGALIALLGWPGMIVHLLLVTAGTALRGQTLGKYLFHLKVTTQSGEKLTWGRAFARTIFSLWMPIVVGLLIFTTHGFDAVITTIEQLRIGELERMQSVIVAMAVSNGFLTLLYAAGLVFAAFHRQKRAMHDLLVGSVVTYQLPERTG